MSGHAAARAVAAGDQVHRLPASFAALDAGQIGFAHFSLLAGVARALQGVPSDAGDTDLDASSDGDAAAASGTNPSDPGDTTAPTTAAIPTAFAAQYADVYRGRRAAMVFDVVASRQRDYLKRIEPWVAIFQ
jgi:hypothetical protein